MIRQRALPLCLCLGFVLSAMVVTVPAFASDTTCNVRASGAKGDGVTKDTQAIQTAIDACERKGGGVVVLNAGTYLSAPIVLKNNITLHLDKGATLLGSADHADYPAITEFRAPGVQALVSATNAENVSITGEGVIDGAGRVGGRWLARSRILVLWGLTTLVPD